MQKFERKADSIKLTPEEKLLHFDSLLKPGSTLESTWERLTDSEKTDWATARASFKAAACPEESNWARQQAFLNIAIGKKDDLAKILQEMWNAAKLAHPKMDTDEFDAVLLGRFYEKLQGQRKKKFFEEGPKSYSKAMEAVRRIMAQEKEITALEETETPPSVSLVDHRSSQRQLDNYRGRFISPEPQSSRYGQSQQRYPDGRQSNKQQSTTSNKNSPNNPDPNSRSGQSWCSIHRVFGHDTLNCRALPEYVRTHSPFAQQRSHSGNSPASTE